MRDRDIWTTIKKIENCISSNEGKCNSINKARVLSRDANRCDVYAELKSLQEITSELIRLMQIKKFE